MGLKRCLHRTFLHFGAGLPRKTAAQNGIIRVRDGGKLSAEGR